MDKIFVISGHAHTGKNYIGNLIKKYYLNKNKTVVVTSFAKYLKLYAKEIIGWDETEPKPRAFLQNIGVEIIKNKIDNEFLIKRMLEDIKVYEYYTSIVVICDARFKEEIDAIKNNYKKVITIKVNKETFDLNKKEKEHITETALDSYNNYDYVIDNNVDLKIEEILNEVDYE